MADRRDLKRPAWLRKLDARQQASPWTAVPAAVLKKFGDDQADSLAALIAYYAFFSLFPLLLLMVAVLGFVLAGDQSAQRQIEHSVLAQFPIIGSGLRERTLHGSVLSVLIGVAGLLWGGLSATGAAEQAFDRVFAVPRRDRPGYLVRKLRGVAEVAAIGALSVAGALSSGLVSGGLGLGGLVVRVLAICVSLAVNAALFTVTIRLLSVTRPSNRSIACGALVAAALWLIGQLLGGAYVSHVVRHASEIAGLFAVVLGLLAWLHVLALILLLGAEVTSVVDGHLWPRSFL